MASAGAPGADTLVSTVLARLSGVLGRERSVSLFAGGEDALPFGLAVLCLVAAAEAAFDNPGLPCAEATRARSN